MDVRVSKKGDVSIVTCSGTIRTDARERIPEAMKAVLETGARLCVVDMREVPWTDTAGVAEITAAHKRMTDRGGKVVLVPSRRVRDVLEITQLTRVFEIYEDVEQALAGLRAEPS